MPSDSRKNSDRLLYRRVFKDCTFHVSLLLYWLILQNYKILYNLNVPFVFFNFFNFLFFLVSSFVVLQFSFLTFPSFSDFLDFFILRYFKWKPQKIRQKLRISKSSNKTKINFRVVRHGKSWNKFIVDECSNKTIWDLKWPFNFVWFKFCRFFGRYFLINLHERYDYKLRNLLN